MSHDTLFSLASPEDEAVLDGRAEACALLLLLHEAARFWLWASEVAHPELATSLAVASLGALAAGAFPPARRAAGAIMAALLAVRIWATFPSTANHTYLGFYALTFLAICGTRTPGDRRLLLTAWAWLAVGVLGWAGLQKALHGTYFQGQFFAFSVAAGESTGDIVRWLVDATETARLESTDPYTPGAGPFRLTSWPALIVSNAVWVLEILIALGLLVRRWRPTAALVGIALVASIQLGARELLYGLLLSALLLPQLRSNQVGRAVPVYAAIYVVLVGSRLGEGPSWEFN